MNCYLDIETTGLEITKQVLNDIFRMGEMFEIVWQEDKKL